MARNKYNAKPVWICKECGLQRTVRATRCVCGHPKSWYFQSQGEAGRFVDLRMLEKHGSISGLKTQVRFPIVVNGVDCGSYLADFTYRKDGKEVVEDFKGMKTQLYSLKKKLVEAIHEIEVIEITR